MAPRILAVALLGLAVPVVCAEELKNWFGDPYFQVRQAVGESRIDAWGLGGDKSFAAKYDKLFVRALSHHAVWPPLTAVVELGDFGRMRRGVFERIGNIREFGVEVAAQTGPSTSLLWSVNVASELRASDSELRLEFERDGAYVRAAAVSVRDLRSLDTVATQLQDHGDRRWRSGWLIVGRIFIAHDATVLASDDKAGAVLRGTAAALHELEAGRTAANIHVEVQHGEVFHAIADHGPLMFDLFRLRRFRGVLQPVA